MSRDKAAARGANLFFLRGKRNLKNGKTQNEGGATFVPTVSKHPARSSHPAAPLFTFTYSLRPSLMADKTECVKVVVRIRPLSKKETEDGRRVSITARSERSEVVIESAHAEGGGAPKVFTFDATYGPDAKQEQIYVSSAYPIVESVLKGFNGTIFAVRVGGPFG